MDETRLRLARTIGANIRAARIRLGVSQYVIADRLMTRQAVISDWEQGRKLPNLDSLYFLAKVLKVALPDLLVGL